MNANRESIGKLAETQAATVEWSKLIGISAAILMGTFIIFSVGFASPEMIHNAAHDARNVLVFP